MARLDGSFNAARGATLGELMEATGGTDPMVRRWIDQVRKRGHSVRRTGPKAWIMFGFLKRRDPTKEAAEIATSLAGAVAECAGWRDQMTGPRLLATGVLTIWGAQVMRMTNLELGLVGEEALKLGFHHRTPEAEKALHDNVVLLHESLKYSPLHDRCCHKFARFIMERDLVHLQDLARDTLPALEAEAAKHCAP